MTKESDTAAGTIVKESEKAGENRVCRLCLIYEEAGQAADLEKYLARLKKEDLVDDTEFTRRIGICRGCEHLLGATCRACGCYVEFRANMKRGTCPKKKW